MGGGESYEESDIDNKDKKLSQLTSTFLSPKGLKGYNIRKEEKERYHNVNGVTKLGTC